MHFSLRIWLILLFLLFGSHFSHSPQQRRFTRPIKVVLERFNFGQLWKLVAGTRRSFRLWRTHELPNCHLILGATLIVKLENVLGAFAYLLKISWSCSVWARRNVLVRLSFPKIRELICGAKMAAKRWVAPIGISWAGLFFPPFYLPYQSILFLNFGHFSDDQLKVRNRSAQRLPSFSAFPIFLLIVFLAAAATNVHWG